MKKIINYTLILLVALTSIIACSSDEENVTGDKKPGDVNKGDVNTGDVNPGGNTGTSDILIEDAIFIKYLKEKLNVVIDAKGGMTKEEAEKVTEIVCDNNYEVRSFKGIEFFTNLVTFNVSENHSLASLDLRKNVKIKNIYIGTVEFFNTLNIEGCTALTDLYITLTPIESLELKDVPNLERIKITKSDLSSLILSKNLPKVEELDLSSTSMQSINLTRFPSLRKLNLGNSRLTSIDLSKNGELYFLALSGSKKLSSLDLKNNPFLRSVFCNKADLRSLDLSAQNPINLSNAEFRDSKKLGCVVLNGTNKSLNHSGWYFDNPNIAACK